jgi:hypothetical protein
VAPPRRGLDLHRYTPSSPLRYSPSLYIACLVCCFCS